ncbi:MAG: signal recognition particle protein Srp19 [Thaumarchaeota archaeon]|nr:signal recognition particle protein Srp19 [Nitrososphaerota archaeon]
MKSYDRYVVWLDYLDSERKRSDGRRVPLNSCTRAPTLEELVQACTKLGLEPESQASRYPGDTSRLSGYVSVKKAEKEPKQRTLIRIARELSQVRGQKPASQKKV